MGRSQIWDGLEWVSMTGGAGEDSGGGTPDDDYLRLDGANNPASPNTFLRESAGDARYLKLTGGTLTGLLVAEESIEISTPAQTGSRTLKVFRLASGVASEALIGVTNVTGFQGSTLLRSTQDAAQYDYYFGEVFYPHGRVEMNDVLDMDDNVLTAVGDPTNSSAAMSRGYADLRYVQETARAIGVIIDRKYYSESATVTGSLTTIASFTLAVDQGQPMVIDVVGMLRAASVPEGGRFSAQIYIDGTAFTSAETGSGTVSQGSHSHSISGGSHNHSVPSTAFASPSGTHSHNHGQSANTGSTTPSGRSIGSTTPSISVGGVSMSATCLAQRGFTPSGSTVLVEMKAEILGGSPSNWRAQLKASAFTD